MNFSSFLIESAFELLLEDAQAGAKGHEPGTMGAIGHITKKLNEYDKAGKFTHPETGETHKFSMADLTHRNHGTETGHHPALEHATKSAIKHLKNVHDGKEKLEVEHFRHEGNDYPASQDKSPHGVFSTYVKSIKDKKKKDHLINSSAHSAAESIHQAAKHIGMEKGDKFTEHHWTSNDHDIKRLIGKHDSNNPSDGTLGYKKKGEKEGSHFGLSFKYKGKPKTNYKNMGEETINSTHGLPKGTVQKETAEHKKRLEKAGYNIKLSHAQRHQDDKDTQARIDKGKGTPKDKNRLKQADESRTTMLKNIAGHVAGGLKKKLTDDKTAKEHILNSVMPKTHLPYAIVTGKTHEKADHAGTMGHGSHEELKAHLDEHEDFHVHHDGGTVVHIKATNKKTGKTATIMKTTVKTNRGNHHPVVGIANLDSFDNAMNEKNKQRNQQIKDNK